VFHHGQSAAAHLSNHLFGRNQILPNQILEALSPGGPYKATCAERNSGSGGSGLQRRELAHC
jgi:hypothetical protein